LQFGGYMMIIEFIVLVAVRKLQPQAIGVQHQEIHANPMKSDEMYGGVRWGVHNRERQSLHSKFDLRVIPVLSLYR
jgi:hypothetical protein